MRKPDFFIAGAPKCGTTAMADYLAQHPEIYLPAKKELHFFGSDLQCPSFTRDPEAYAAHFAAWGRQPIGGEAAVWYLYSRRAAAEIREFNPRAKVIIQLRNPLELIPSLHSQLVYTGDESIADLREALAAEEDRKRGLRQSTATVPPEALYYREVCRFSEQVKRYLDRFGPGQVHVILFDDLKADAREVYRGALRFLGVDPGFDARLEVVNPNKRIRSLAFQRLLRDPPPLVRRLARLLLPPAGRKRLIEALYHANTRIAPREPLGPEIERRLRDEFREEVERLSALLGRDLSSWTAREAVPAR